ncbi:hypothetical protein [Streptomyces sp. NBC_01589]|uniref:hypothetical protein n=1 Tax=unclassified Streptomyces TaxID=2593676 RepID=UPI003864A1B9
MSAGNAAADSALDAVGLPCRPRPEPSRRRQWPRVLLIVVLLPADVDAAAVGVVAGEFDPQVPAPDRRAEVRGMNGGSLAVPLGKSGGEVACAVMVNDGTFGTASASEAFATAACGGF